MSSCPAGLRRLSFDVIGPAFSRRPPPVAAHLDIGAAVRKLSRFAVLSVSEKAGRTRSRLLEERPATSQSPGCLRTVACPSCRDCSCVHASKNWMAWLPSPTARKLRRRG